MSQIVQRIGQRPTPAENSANLLPARSHRAGGIFVQSQLALGIEPTLVFSWSIVPRYWSKGYTLMIFRSSTGFCPEKYPDDLNRHGALIAETYHDDRYEERPAEGTYYYTFLLHKRICFGLKEKMTLVRFSETIPSAKVGIGRIQDKITLEEMLQRHELGKIEHEAKLSEAELRRIHAKRKLTDAMNLPPKEKTSVHSDPIVAEQLSAVDAIIEAILAKHQKIEQVENDPRLRKLSPTKRKEALKTIRERLDPGEISARRERRGR